MYRHNGAGEMLVYSAADYEDFREPRPEIPPNMEGDLERVVRHLAQVNWPFRLHATYDETIGRALDVFEKVNKEVPFAGIHWFIDHAETIQATGRISRGSPISPPPTRGSSGARSAAVAGWGRSIT
jgi:predicted amidohydrolase YtcJ